MKIKYSILKWAEGVLTRIIFLCCVFTEAARMLVQTISLICSVCDESIFSPVGKPNHGAKSEMSPAEPEDENQSFDEFWATMSVDKRIGVLRIVANAQARYLGLPHEVKVIAIADEENLVGIYSDDQHIVGLNIEVIKNYSPRKILNVLIHEVYHAYEYRMAELYNGADETLRNLRALKRAGCYSEELASYITPEQDSKKYRRQIVELDSDLYAMDTMKGCCTWLESIYKRTNREEE